MPTYEFRLPDGTIIERTFKISEVPAEIPNPNGEGTAVRIISGGAGLLFKGSGFYLTDYGAGGAASPAKPEGAASASGGESKSSSGESKSSSGEAKSSTSEAKAAPAPKSEPKSSGSGPAAP